LSFLTSIILFNCGQLLLFFRWQPLSSSSKVSRVPTSRPSSPGSSPSFLRLAPPMPAASSPPFSSPRRSPLTWPLVPLIGMRSEQLQTFFCPLFGSPLHRADPPPLCWFLCPSPFVPPFSALLSWILVQRPVMFGSIVVDLSANSTVPTPTSRVALALCSPPPYPFHHPLPLSLNHSFFISVRYCQT